MTDTLPPVILRAATAVPLPVILRAAKPQRRIQDLKEELQ